MSNTDSIEPPSCLIDLDIFAMFGELDELDYEMEIEDEGTIQPDVGEIQETVNDGRRELEIREVVVKQVPPGIRTYKCLEMGYFVAEEMWLEQQNTNVYLSYGKSSYLVGVAKGVIKSRILIKSKNCLKRGDTYQEEIGGKGTRLAFSSYVHSVAVVMICDPDEEEHPCIIEPYDGSDVEALCRDAMTNTYSKSNSMPRIEITGNNYRDRPSSCNWILNKYLLISYMVPPSPKLDWFFKMSRAEETNDSLVWLETALKTTDSPYSSVIQKLHSKIRLMKDSQFKEISNHYKRWFSLMKSTTKVETVPIKTDILQQGAKIASHALGSTTKGSLTYPAPFRILTMPDVSIDVDVHLKINVITPAIWQTQRTTYHRDRVTTIEEMISKSEHLPRPKLGETMIDRLSDYVSKFKIIQNIRIEGELFPCIGGNEGQYFSEVHNMGLAWKRTSRDSMLFNCCYYVFSQPEDTLGKWTKIGYHWQSPVFTVSKPEVEFANTLWARVLTLMEVAFNEVPRNKRMELIDPLLLLFNCWHNSTWQTAKHASSCRFIVTGHMAGNDVRGLASESIDTRKYDRSADHKYKVILNRFIENGSDINVTPIFRFPIALMCLEKDWVNGTMFKNRQCDHDTRAVAKLIKGYYAERDFVNDVVSSYEKQLAYIDKVLNEGVYYYETAELLDNDCKHPHINIVCAIASIWHCKEDLIMASSSQCCTDFCINNLLSDHGSLTVDGDKYIRRKVVDTLSELLIELKPDGPYSLLYSILTGEKFEQTFALNSKNGRGHREFATQPIRCRVLQFFEECMATAVAKVLPEDRQKADDKYNAMVKEISRFMTNRKTVITSSQDRTFHCGNNNIECNSLWMLITGCIINSHPMVCIAGSMMCKSVRSVQFPRDYVGTMPETVSSLYVGGGITKEQRLLKDLYYHSQQGMSAQGSGFINSTFMAGHANMCRDLSSDIEDSYVIVTQDDAGVCMMANADISSDSLKRMTIFNPSDLLYMSSQVNNLNKLVNCDKKLLIEVNNIAVAGVNDKCIMLTENPIWICSNIQPLNGQSPFEDILTVWNRSISCLSWGGNPTMMSSSFSTGMQQMMRRWCMTEGSLQYLRFEKWIPCCFEELIQGPFPYDYEKFKIMLGLFNHDSIKLLREGLCDIYYAMKRCSKSFKVQDDYGIETAFEYTNLLTCDFKRKQIYTSRTMSGRLKANNARLKTESKKGSCVQHMLNLLSSEIRHDEALCLELYDLLKPPKLNYIIRPMNRDDHTPKIMGNSVQTSSISLKRIMCKRLLGIYHRDVTSEEEDQIIKLDDSAFGEFLILNSRRVKIEGRIAHCPGGLPTVQFHEGTIYRNLHVFEYNYDIMPSEPVIKPTVINGRELLNVRPCLWGGATLKKGCAFATGEIHLDDTIETIVLYKLLDERLCWVRVEEVSDYINIINHRGKEIYFLKGREDWTPFNVDCDDGLFYITGDSIARSNYGGRLRSKHNFGFKQLQSLYREVGMDLPFFMYDKYPQYPRFSVNSLVFEASLARLVGSSYVCDCHIKYNKIHGKVEVDLSGRPIHLVEYRATAALLE